MDASQLPKGQSLETNADGRPLNLPGVYREKETGKEITTAADFAAGVAQADAILAVGERTKTTWERVGDVPSHQELLELRKAQAIKDATVEALERGKEEADLKEAKAKALKEAKEAEAKAPVAV